MHQEFLHWYDKQSNFSAPEVSPEEIDLYLNEGQETLLNLLAEQGLEKSQEWLDYTKNITRSYSTVPVPSTNKPNGWSVILPLGVLNNQANQQLYRLALLEEVSITYTSCGSLHSSRVPVIPVTRDEYNTSIHNPFKKPWKEEVLRLTTDANSFELIGFTGATLTTYYLDYIKEPNRIQYGSQYATPLADQSCELESKAAAKIINIAVALALQTIGDNRIAFKQFDKLINTI